MPAHTSLDYGIPYAIWEILIHHGLLPARIVLHVLIPTRIHLQTDLLYHRDILIRSLTCGGSGQYLVR